MAGTPSHILVAQPESERVRVGMGGWTFEPWRDNFHRKGLPHAEALGYAIRHTCTVAIDGTCDGTKMPESIRKWQDEVPDHFEAFLALLPKDEGSHTLRHVMDVRDPHHAEAAEAGEKIQGDDVFTGAATLPWFEEPGSESAGARLMMR